MIPLYVVIGTRAQLIKTAPVLRELEQRHIDYRFIYTAQHRETIDDIRTNFGIKAPDYVFPTGEEAKTMGLFGKWFLLAFFQIIFKRKEIIPRPGLVITHGDTATCLLGALLGKWSRCRVMHLESGLRSFNLLKPFPEELIRLLTFRMTDIFVCPNEWALKNVSRYQGVKLDIRANTQYDSVMLALGRLSETQVDLPIHPYAVVSIHRFEHIFRKNKLQAIVAILERISEQIDLLFILHPATERQLARYGYDRALAESKNIRLAKRYPFFEFIKVLYHAKYVITDGGSNQEELSYLGKPTLVLRDVTERVEGLGANVVLAKFEPSVISDFVAHYQKYEKPMQSLQLSPSKRIVDYLENTYGSQK